LEIAQRHITKVTGILGILDIPASKIISEGDLRKSCRQFLLGLAKSNLPNTCMHALKWCNHQSFGQSPVQESEQGNGEQKEV